MASGPDGGPVEGEAVSDHDQREDYDDHLGGDHLAADSLVRWPASAMWVLGLMQLIVVLVGTAFAVYLTVADALDDGRTVDEIWMAASRDEAFWFVLGAWPLAIACPIIVMRGANNLRQFRRYWWAVTAGILTLLALPFFYLGVFQLPLGLWALLLLARRDVRARFDAVARGTILSDSQGSAAN